MRLLPPLLSSHCCHYSAVTAATTHQVIATTAQQSLLPLLSRSLLPLLSRSLLLSTRQVIAAITQQVIAATAQQVTATLPIAGCCCPLLRKSLLLRKLFLPTALQVYKNRYQHNLPNHTHTLTDGSHKRELTANSA